LFNIETLDNRTAIDNIHEWPLIERLEKERSAIGFYLNSHPMDVYSEFLRGFLITRSRDFASIANGNVTTAGVLINKKEKFSKNAQKYAFINISDQDNTFEVTVMPSLYQQTLGMLVPGRALLLEISIKKIDEAVKIIANSIQSIESILSKQKIYLEIAEDTNIEELTTVIQNMEDGDNSISFIVQHGNSIRKSEIETKYKKKISIEDRKKFQSIKGVKIYEPPRNNSFR
jgi:DNA polymerase-3 subunit alpha